MKYLGIFYKILAIAGIFTELTSFISPIMFMGNTEPGGVLARQNQMIFVDSARYAFGEMGSSYLKNCFQNSAKNIFLFVSGLQTSVKQHINKVHMLDTRIGIGYLNSPEALIAALESEKLNFPINSPGTTLDTFFKTKYFRSIGLSISEQARHVSETISPTKGQAQVDIIVPVDQVFSLSLSKNLQGFLDKENSEYQLIEYISTDPNHRVNLQSNLTKSVAKTIIFTGYWIKSFEILRNLEKPQITIFRNSEWAYNEDALENGLRFKNDIYFIADYTPASITGKFESKKFSSFSPIKSRLQEFNFHFNRTFGYKKNALVTSLIDATYIACGALKTAKSPMQFDFIKSYESIGVFWGLKGFFEITPNKQRNSAILRKSDGGNFISTPEFTAEMK
jgi:hypothetical protein